MQSPRTLFFWVILAVFVTSTAAAREWKDKKGNKRTGEFVRFEAGNVVIEARGAEFSVPFEKLSAQDQEFVRNKLEELGQSDLLPGSNRPTVTNPMDPVTPDDPIRDDTAQSPTPNPADGSIDDLDTDPMMNTDGGMNGPPPSGAAKAAYTITWTDINGHSWEAFYTQVQGGDVFFRTEAGLEFRFPFDQLSDYDQDFIRTDQAGGFQDKVSVKKEKRTFRMPAWAFAIFGVSIVILLIAIMIKTLERLSSKTA